jgi:hypothetical protein
LTLVVVFLLYRQIKMVPTLYDVDNDANLIHGKS